MSADEGSHDDGQRSVIRAVGRALDRSAHTSPVRRSSAGLLAGGELEEGTQPRPHDGRPLPHRTARRPPVVGRHRRPQCADSAGTSRSAASLRAGGRRRRRLVTGRTGRASRARPQGLRRPPGAAVGAGRPTSKTRAAARFDAMRTRRSSSARHGQARPRGRSGTPRTSLDATPASRESGARSSVPPHLPRVPQPIAVTASWRGGADTCPRRRASHSPGPGHLHAYRFPPAGSPSGDAHRSGVRSARLPRLTATRLLACTAGQEAPLRHATRPGANGGIPGNSTSGADMPAERNEVAEHLWQRASSQS